MELRDLRVYLAVVDAGGFTRAAGRVHLVQSAISDAVARLERELGVRLLERRRAGVRPTPAGETLARWARLLVSGADRAVRDVAALRTGGAGTLRLGLLPTITPMVLPPLLEALHARRPVLEVRVREGLAPDLLERVRTGELDLAVVFFPTERHPELEFVDVAARPLSVLVGAGHHLSGRRRLRLAEAAGEGWITYPPHNPGRLWLDGACRLAGFTPRIAAEVETAMQQQIFVQAGVGVAMVPFARGRARSLPGLARLVPLLPPLPEFRIGYAHDPRTADPPVAEARVALEQILRAA